MFDDQARRMYFRKIINEVQNAQLVCRGGATDYHYAFELAIETAKATPSHYLPIFVFMTDGMGSG